MREPWLNLPVYQCNKRDRESKLARSEICIQSSLWASRVVSSEMSPHVYHLINMMCRFIVSVSYPGWHLTTTSKRFNISEQTAKLWLLFPCSPLPKNPDWSALPAWPPRANPCAKDITSNTLRYRRNLC